MTSPTESRVIYESDLSIFNGRLCSLRILIHSQTENRVKIRVTSSSDVSILLDRTIEFSECQKLIDILNGVIKARAQDPTILGPRVDQPRNSDIPLINIPMAQASPEERCDHVLQLYLTEKTQHQAQIAKTDELSKQLQSTVTEYNALRQRCEFGEKEINLLRQLTRSNSENRKRNRDDSDSTPMKKRRCRCGDDESCGSDCDGEMEEDEEEDDDISADVQMFRAAASQLQMSGRESHNGEGGFWLKIAQNE
ncbi:hypothetical protein GCK72_002902 [Caenorhabditis remanei]|uniref:Uncharacterized protein n=1 Tax=Caenorhabditis remanei TaxID=31234 RepID=A0A6A5HX93_CAERE|nr:hypothetical protein GCK72_002902 [Caenorhabditis remanei]KAF1771077.1 hypothetical protein GCK72_002902 [Caenorhabditis remanei]